MSDPQITGPAVIVAVEIERGDGSPFNVLRFAEYPFRANGNDYLPLLAEPPSFSRTLGTVLWRDGSNTSVGDIKILTGDGNDTGGGSFRLNPGFDLRDNEARIYTFEIDRTSGIQSRVLRATGIIDNVRFGLLQAVFELRSTEVLLERSVQTTVYDDATGNPEGLAGKTVPLTLGQPLNVEPVFIDSVAELYDVHEEPPQDIIEVRDKGVVLTEGAGADWVESGNGFDLDNSADGAVTCDPAAPPDTNGSFTLGSDMVTNGDFANWTSDDPDNWDVTENAPNAVVTEAVSGECTIQHKGGFVFPAINQDVDISAGRYYRFTVDIKTMGTNDSLQLQYNGSTIKSWSNTTGVKTYDFVGEEGASDISLTVAAFDSGSNTRIDDVKVQEKQWDNVLTTVGDLIDWLTDRHGDISVDLTGLETGSPNFKDYEIGLYITGSETYADVFDMIAESIGAYYVPDVDGTLLWGVLPSDPDDNDSILEITESDLIGDLEIQWDNAPGLSTRMGVKRNWAMQSADSLAGSVDDRKQLYAGKYQKIISATNSNLLDHSYAPAKNACPRTTLLVDESQAQTILDREVEELYDRRRVFIDCRIGYGAQLNIDPGDVVVLNIPHYGLEQVDGNGLPMMVVSVDGNYGDNELNLTLWGGLF